MKITRINKGLINWNRKVHIYIGLSLLFFIMLFGFSGLMLNHHWEFTRFWENRKVTNHEKNIQISEEREREALVLEVADKLQLHGSIINPRYSEDSSLLNFIVAKPGTRYDVQAHLNEGKVSITEAKFNQWGTMRNLHTIRNPTQREQNNRHQSALSAVWSISIDIISIGLIVICLGGWFLWLHAERRRFYLGLISLAGGIIICLYFLLF